jgi:serine/threonine protein kinase
MSQVRFAESHEEIPNDETKASSTGRTHSPAPEPENGNDPRPATAEPGTPTITPPAASLSTPQSRPKHYKRSSSSSFHSKVIRENLMREIKDRDPLFYYEVASVLGVGSMGSVAKVRKRDSVVGGSARKGLQKHFEKERKLKVCFSLPFVGGMFRACLDRDDDSKSGSNRSHDGDSSTFVSNVVSSSTRSRNSSILNTKSAKFEAVNLASPLSIDGQSEASGSTYEQYYAMKSIHLSRVTDPSFVEELKNEIQILRSLDHPRAFTQCSWRP